MVIKKDSIEIALSAINSVMPKNLIDSYINFDNYLLNILGIKYDLSKYNNIYVYGSGKASIAMAKSLKNILKNLVKEYFIVSNYKEELKGIEVLESSHPIPTEKSLIAANMLIHKLKKLESNDLFIYLLSGGTSSLIEKPIDGIRIKDISYITRLMLKKGLSIDEINLFRKKLSKVKNGGLAKITKAEGIVLVISDVINDDLLTIGSAPFIIKSEKDINIVKLLKKYDILNQLSPKIRKIIASNNKVNNNKVNNSIESDRIKHFIIGNNLIALNKAKKKAEELNYKTKIVTPSLSGNVKVVSNYLVDLITPNSFNQCLLFGGETTVNVKGKGQGGRNTELLLWILKAIQNRNLSKEISFLSIGTDGIDGNSDSAGGVINGFDYKDDVDNFLKDNDSYNFLKRDNNLIFTKETGTNVMDIIIVLIPKE